jgi:hypothetical protein
VSHRLGLRIRHFVVAVLGVFALGLPSVAAAAPSVQFADWTAVSNNVATGTLLGHTVTFSGTTVDDPPGSTIDGTSNLLSESMFTPPITLGDHLSFRVFAPSTSYTLDFGAPTTDPIIDLGSDGSTLTFPAGTSITRISGDAGLTVAGNVVSGAGNTTVDPVGLNDSNGTIQLNGTFQSISFSSTTAYPLDGVYLQVGASPPPPPTTTTTPTTTTPSPPPPTTTPIPIPVLGNRVVDIRVSGIEVTQAIQWSGCPGCDGTLPSRIPVKSLAGVVPASVARYQGVRMVAGHYTVVRVFATFTRPADLSAVGRVTAKLDVLDSNGNLIETLAPDSGPATLSKSDCWTCVTLAQRADAGGSFNFLVPWQETYHRQLGFRATITPIRFAGALLPTTQCSTCHGNVFTLTGVPFVQTVNVPIHPIRLAVNTATATGVLTSSSETQVFGSAQTVLPVNLQVFPYEADLPVSDNSAGCGLPAACRGTVSANAAAAVAKRAGQDGYTNAQYAIGVFPDHVGTGYLGGLTTSTLFGSGPAISIARDDRPLTSVMHEIGHGLGLPHADTGSFVGPPVNDNTGPHPDGTPDCGGNSNGQPGEAWPPDNEGLITATPVNENQIDPTGVGLDRRNWNPLQTGSLPRPVVQGFPNPGDLYYDFMSYCGPAPSDAVFESNHWISVRNWNQLIDFHPPVQALASDADTPTRQTTMAPVRVLATVDASGTGSIFDVLPGQRALTGPTAGSPYRIELLDAAGSLIASAVPGTTSIEVDGAPSSTLLDATLPDSPAAASVAVMLGGRELTHRDRSRHAPTVQLVSPRPGSRLARGRATVIRWRAHDGDNDLLLVTVSYSADRGRHWKVIADQPTGSSVRVPSRAFSHSQSARIRVTVSDGFNLTTATAEHLRVPGAPPGVRIIHLGQGSTLRTGQALLLQGTAFDDAGNPLTGSHLRWYANKRPIGRGALLTVRHLLPGPTTVTLTATDDHGLTSTATLRIKVLGPNPVLTQVRAPSKVPATARRIRITIASNVAADFTIAGAHHHLTSRPRTLTIAIRPGQTTLRLRYTLRSSGGIAHGTYVVSR